VAGIFRQELKERPFLNPLVVASRSSGSVDMYWMKPRGANSPNNNSNSTQKDFTFHQVSALLYFAHCFKQL
jgi:hypothetical protein